LDSLVIPNSVISIGVDAFAKTPIKTVSISNSLSAIGQSVFYETHLKTAVIPDSVASIEYAAFRNTTSLESVEIPASVTSIGPFAFADTSLTTVSIPNPDVVIEEGAFDPSVIVIIGDSTPGAVSKPVIGKQESEAVGQAGGSLILVVEVLGEGLSYQWQKDGVDVAGATSATLELTDVSESDAGSYVLKASNEGGSVTSEPIVVSVKSFVIMINGKASGSKVNVVDKALVEIESGKPGWFTYYTLDGSAPENGLEYEVPFELTSGATIRTIAYPPLFDDELVGPSVDLTVLKSQVLSVEAPQGVVYGAAPVSLVGSSDSGLPVSFEVVEGPGKVEGGKFEATGSGVVTVKAKQAGNDEYAAVEKSFEVLVGKGTQEITWVAVPAKTYGDGPFEVSASASSGLPLSYGVVGGPATIEGAQVTLTGGGTVVLKASQAGNTDLKAASAEVSVAVARAKQTITFTSLYGTREYTSESIKLGATSSSGLSVAYQVMQGAATVFGDELTLTGVGEVTVRAKQLGNGNYEAASAVDRTFRVIQGSQSVEIVLADQVTWQAEPVEVGVKSSSGLKAFELQVLSGPGELEEGNKLKLTGVGVVKLVLREPGDARYGSAMVQKDVEVVKASQTIEFEALPGQIGFHAEPIELRASASSGLEVTYEVVSVRTSNGEEAWSLSSSEVWTAPLIDGKFELPMKGLLPQTVTVKAIQTGSDVYNAAESVEQVFALVRGKDVLSFEPIGNRLVEGGDIELEASAASGLNPTFSMVNGPARVISGKLEMTGSEGGGTVRASTRGNKYYEATELEQSFEVKNKGWIALEGMSGGTVELDPAQELYDPGTEVKLTPKPGEGYEFAGWSGAVDGTASPKSVTVNAPMSVGAKF